MTNQEIFELMARFDQSGITTFKLNTKDFTLELGKGGSAAVPAAPVGAPAPAAAAPAPKLLPLLSACLLTLVMSPYPRQPKL